ncbi:uncharacterized protein LOC144919333 [Branchiostoma floridae x Branchiostoma belcheri]
MRVFLAVVVVVLACIPAGNAVKCPWCGYERTRAQCLEQPWVTCSVNQLCVTTHSKFKDRGEGWKNVCDTREACDAGKKANPAACKLEDSVFSCVSCCDKDGCVGGAAATKISPHAIVAAAFLFIANIAMLL